MEHTKNAIFHVIDNHDIEELEKLLKEGINLHVFDPSSYNDTPLHKSIRENKNAIARKLIDSNAPLDCSNNFGDTPLHLAVMNRNLEIIIILLEAGANINAVNNNNKTPPEIANEMKFQEIIRFFEKLHT